ncbi:MAG: hypothetical protein GYA51_15655 [Candidatus Methanofastidiosa archaeon]|nr:hypothetical protein [Candidatus Methanofastidiosa archaeon]
MLEDIFVNIIANFIYTILVTLILWLLYILIKRNKLLLFFGVKKNKKISIYISHLFIKRGGSNGLDDISYSFNGSAIPYEESKAANDLKNVFNYFLPSQMGTSSIINKILISDINVNVLASPRNKKQINQATSFITIGLPAYNSVSKYVEDNFKLNARLNYIDSGNETKLVNNDLMNNTKINLSAGTAIPENNMTISASSIHIDSEGKNCKQPIIVFNNHQNEVRLEDTSVGFVQRICESGKKTRIYYLAGLSENSTAGCVYFLINNWEYLNSKYKNDTSFSILIRVEDNDNKISQIIFEK